MFQLWCDVNSVLDSDTVKTPRVLLECEAFSVTAEEPKLFLEVLHVVELIYELNQGSDWGEVSRWPLSSQFFFIG